MTILKTWAAAMALFGTVCSSSVLAEGRTGQLAPPVSRAVTTVVLPAYAALTDRADRQLLAMTSLCKHPTLEALEATREAFGSLVSAFSAVEWIRFGPARTDNRFERLFFWPDRRGLGRRQVEAIIRKQDATAIEVDTLRDKSVAVQGLPALDHVLYGDGADAMLVPGSYRCSYARAVAGAVAGTAREIHEDWRRPHGFAATMTSPGVGNTVFRTDGEALQQLLKSAAEMLQIVAGQKLLAVIGGSPGNVRPKRAPFWHSNQTLRNIDANIKGILALHDALDLEPLLPAHSRHDAVQFTYEIGNVGNVLEKVSRMPGDFPAIAGDPDGHGSLKFVSVVLVSTAQILQGRYLPALGLAAGFNALDGD